jgi:SAM-dependent methyltransferase
VSAFSAVDQADDPQCLVAVLDRAALGLAAMKHYMAAAHQVRQPVAPVLDLGCGSGHDLAVLESLGVSAIGVDPSSVMIAVAAGRFRSPVLRAAGERLPFADGVFSGCWIERVLMHVADPVTLIDEVVRCVQPGGLLTVFEPDWSSLIVNGRSVPTEWLSAAAHPAIGSIVGDLLAAANCTVLDRVGERSWWTYEEFERITNLERSLDRAVTNGKASRAVVEAWLTELRQGAARADFRAEITKTLWVATTAT